MDHENLLKQFGSFVNGGSLSIVSEFADRGKLTELFDHYKEHHWERLKEMTTTQITKLITGIAKGLQVNKLWYIFQHIYTSLRAVTK